MIVRGKLSAFALASVLLAAGALAGCHHEHLSPNYGQSYNAWLAAQRVNRPAEHPEQARRVLEGLDAPEAHIVSTNYLKASAGNNAEQGNGGGGRLLMISPNHGAESTPYMPPPSVPGGQ
jgi:hypothetical protein